MRTRLLPSILPIFALSFGALSLCALSLCAGAARAACPDAQETLRRVEALGLERSSRASRFDFTPRHQLYEKAARKPERTFVDRVGKKGYGVLVTEVPRESFWRAVNDEARHAEYTPVDGSAVVGGTPRGTERLVFQYAKMLGVGRWWVTRVRMNGELFQASHGRIWESWWEDELDAADRSSPPVAEVAGKLEPIEMSRGSWLLADLGGGCTLVELFSWSEAGGVAGAFEALAVERSLRATLEGMRGFADENPVPEGARPPFVLPDGSRLEHGSP
jgi:hypothetical protein